METMIDSKFEHQVLAVLAKYGLLEQEQECGPAEMAASLGMTEAELDAELKKGLKSETISEKEMWAGFGLKSERILKKSI